jgi:hypothetical protein
MRLTIRTQHPEVRRRADRGEVFVISVRQFVLRFGIAPLAATLLVACGGASEAEFIEACLVEAGDSGASQRAVCECGAEVAKSTLSDDAFQAMIYEMGGQSAEASEITAAMSESEQMAFLEGVGQVFERCVLE